MLHHRNTDRIESDEIASRKYGKWKETDPFPDIAPALLNSADIHDYIINSGMIFPYDSENLKSSSYEVMFGDHVIFWDEAGAKRNIKLSRGQSFCIKPNSLVFIVTEQKFRLPEYIALRFNLRINIVHKGLLLGTGPLVDPGFQGKLLIPLHNFTRNEYFFQAGDPFVWVEFTKISKNNKWEPETNTELPQRVGEYKRFPEKKIDISPEQYLYKANQGAPIYNATPAVIAGVKAAVKNLFWGGSITAILAIIAIYFTIYTVVQESINASRNAQIYVDSVREENKDYEEKNRIVEAKIAELEGQLKTLKKRLNAE